MATSFHSRILNWFDVHGRHDLPWQIQPTPYRVWVSEIMLQQTQVNTVIPYYHRFMKRFPTVQDLASADSDQVLHLWTGLGYYARARNLHRAAQIVAEEHAGEFPRSVELLTELPGIGQSTAGAIAALSMDIKAPILDGNVKRVLTRYHAIVGWPERSKIKRRLWEIAESLLPNKNIASYTQAMMDLGATVCTRSSPACECCPLSSDCEAHRQNLTVSIPGKKPGKALPVKSVAMFILQNQSGQVLLQKRPPTGIWGSLFSLPEAADHTQLPELGHLATGLNYPTSSKKLSKIRHSFSHYHLDITPVLSSVEIKASTVMDSEPWLWYPLDHSLEVGLAAPVKKLLTRLGDEETRE